MSENFCFFVYVFTKEKLEGGYKDRVTEDILKFEKDTLFSSDTSTVLNMFICIYEPWNTSPVKDHVGDKYFKPTTQKCPLRELWL